MAIRESIEATAIRGLMPYAHPLVPSCPRSPLSAPSLGPARPHSPSSPASLGSAALKEQRAPPWPRRGYPTPDHDKLRPARAKRDPDLGRRMSSRCGHADGAQTRVLGSPATEVASRVSGP